MFSSAKVVILVVLMALQSLSVPAQMRPRDGPGIGRPGHPRDPRTEEFIRKALQGQREQELVRKAQLVAAGPMSKSTRTD